jgi:hypothetical protein
MSIPNKPAGSTGVSGTSTIAEPTGARPMIKCPKCKADARDVARFCPRCHNTLRFQCPACSHEQRQGGKCDQCGVDFLKYVGAVVAGKKAEADMLHDRIEQRSDLIKNLLWVPITGGFSLMRQLFGPAKRSSK